jgi:hypothetical protein
MVILKFLFLMNSMLQKIVWLKNIIKFIT